MDKKVDVKKRNFGSKIDGTEAAPLELHTVREVLAPDAIRLDDGRTIRLLGIVALPQYEEAARQFLEQKFHKRRIFLKQDPSAPEAGGQPAAYVYLDNRTFVNLHLVRTGLVGVEAQAAYACQEKFLKASQR